MYFPTSTVFFGLSHQLVSAEAVKENASQVNSKEHTTITIAGLCIPSNNTIFINSISKRLAMKEPQLTLEFLEECIQGFRNSNIEMKHLCLEYMTPWLPNLTRSVLFNTGKR